MSGLAGSVWVGVVSDLVGLDLVLPGDLLGWGSGGGFRGGGLGRC